MPVFESGGKIETAALRTNSSSARGAFHGRELLVALRSVEGSGGDAAVGNRQDGAAGTGAGVSLPDDLVRLRREIAGHRPATEEKEGNS